MRKRCAQTITGRQSTWSSAAIITTIATTPATIALTLPCSAATLMYEPRPGRRKS